jgi:predicted permease
MSRLLQDIRFAIRLLIKDRSFTITAFLTLVICVGANTAMFGIVRSVLMKPLPFPESSRILLLYNSYPNAGAPRVGAAVPDYFDRLTAVPGLEAQALFRRENVTFGDESGAERLNSIRATVSFFRLVRAEPVKGRLFTDDEGEVGKGQKALLSHGFALRKFGGPDGAVGKSIRLNGNAFDVVGVLPESFSFLQPDTDVYVPAAFPPDQRTDDQRHSNNWQMVGRLAKGATLSQVQQQVDALNAQNDTKFPEFHQILKDANFHTVVVNLQDDLVRDVKKVLYLLWGGVAFVLLIGCVNIANLVMVRASGRTREMATRHAIGGDLVRLARQLLTETTLLSVAGGAGGLLLGWWALKSVSKLNLDQLPRGYEISLDPVVIGVIAAISVGVGLLIGVVPVIRLWRIKLDVELREESRGGTSSRRANVLRRALATAQVAIALVLLIGAGLLLASFRAVMRLDLGFDPANVVTGSVNLPQTSYREDKDLVAFEQRALVAIRGIPGVEAVGTTSLVPFTGNTSNSVILAEGYQMKPGESLIAPTSVITAGDYFKAMHIKLLRGRFFDQRDAPDAPKTIIVDDRLAKKFWGDTDPIGRRLYKPDDPKDIQKITPKTEFFTVVGVIKEVRVVEPGAEFTPVGAYYFPWEQTPSRGPTFIVRSSSPAILSDVRREIAKIDPQLPVFRTQTMQEWIDRAMVGRRAPMLIAVAFAVVALLLSAVGIYGVLAYGVVQRRRELGVRMALGGTSGNVFGLVLRDGLKIAGIGLAVGLGSSFLVGQLMKSQLFDVAPMNPMIIGAMTGALLVVALVASAIPAWRASRINPIIALSH